MIGADFGAFLARRGRFPTHTKMSRNTNRYNMSGRTVWYLEWRAEGDLSNRTMYKWMFYYNLDDRKQFGRENPS